MAKNKIAVNEVQETPAIVEPVLLKVRALGWYNNGTLINTPWARGEVRHIDPILLKKISNDLPGNWEILND